MLKEFKTFAVKGNVIDMAVGIIIGAAFGSIVSSLVNDLIMPPIGMLLGKVDFRNFFINLSGGSFTSLEEATKAGAVLIKYGVFINILINFFIIAFCVFLLVKGINRLKKKEEAPITQKECPYCFSKINVNAVKCPYCTSDLK